MIYCDEHDPEECEDCGLSHCDGKPKRRGEDAVMFAAELAIQQLNLPKNIAKGGWENADPHLLVERGVEEMYEIYQALYDLAANPCEETKQHVLAERGDAIAFPAMVADIVRKIGVGDDDES